MALKSPSWHGHGGNLFFLYGLWFLPLQKEMFWTRVAETTDCPLKCVVSTSMVGELAEHVAKFLPMECEWKLCVHSWFEP